MTAGDVVAAVLLAAALLAEVICVAGLVWFRTAFDALHFSAAATSVAPLLVAVAAVVTGFSSPSGTVECVVACVALFVLNPAMVAATGRAARLAEYGELGPLPGDRRRS